MATTRSTGPVFSNFTDGVVTVWSMEAFNPSRVNTRRVKFTVWDLSVNPAVIIDERVVESLGPLERVTLTIPFHMIYHTMAVEEDDGISCQDPILVTIYGQNCHGINIAGAVYRNEELITTCFKRLYWYRPADFNHFVGGLSPVSPTAALTSFYDTTVNSTEILDAPPDNYDALMIADVGANFDISAFTGRLIMTFDSGISPLMYWFTGALQNGVYWDYGTQTTLHWVTPGAPDEVGAAGDARIFPALASADGFVRRNDLMEAYSTTAGYDDVVFYQINKNGRDFYWVHFGPHFGSYNLAYTAERLSELVRYALELICCLNPDFPPHPILSEYTNASVLSAEADNSNNNNIA